MLSLPVQLMSSEKGVIRCSNKARFESIQKTSQVSSRSQDDNGGLNDLDCDHDSIFTEREALPPTTQQ